MPVEIILPPKHQLRVKENQSLDLPAIQIVATNSNIPHISRITCSVKGTPIELAAEIQQTYKHFNSATPQKISNLCQLGQYPYQLEKPLTETVNCDLQVIVEYFDSDATGKPILSIKKNMGVSCNLWFTPDFQSITHKTITNHKTMNPFELDTYLNKLSQQLSEKLNEKPKKRFPGWFAVDFGTSNSTVTLFDPIEVPIAEVLPREQELRLRQRLAEWLNSPANLALPDIGVNEWEKFIANISKNLEIEPEELSEVFENDNKEQFLEAIRQIELCLGNSDRFRRAVSKKLYQIYHEVFRVPTLESQNLIPVVLDINRRETEIPSEMEVSQVEPLKLQMGREARDNRKKAIAQGTITSVKDIISRFHHSPKRYFGQNRTFPVMLDDSEHNIQVNQLIQAAWAHLIELTEDYRQRARRRFSEGDLLTGVFTYPTVAPPVVRKEIKALVEELGIDDVQTAYDEAVSVAIFFLWREFGGNLNIGIESFKTRCRQEKNKWSQNVLVLDIGGGTTDLALIELTLEDKTPFFADHEDRGLGGRYYKLTPKLLGSSGHLQLGGELITLRIFRLLKVAIADFLLTAITNGDIESDKLEDLINSELNERFLEEGKFKSGSLLKCVDKENPEGDVAFKDALDTAEKVLPTRWQQAPQRLQTFYTLWDYAEAAKLKLGQKLPGDGSLLTFTLSEQQISEILAQSAVKFQIIIPDAISITIDSQQFERAAISAIKEAIGIAKGLMESRLNADNKQKVDWLILSGKTCNLDLVQKQIYQEFSKSPYFVWNPERITFVLEFTKLATSAGACYAEKLRRLRFDPEESKNLLRKGANQLEINVKNLFYYLPCNFKRKTQSNELLGIFNAGQELYQLAAWESVAKVRTNWQGIQLTNIIYRQDYEDGELRLWGSFDGKTLMEKLGMEEPEFLKKIKVQFEIDQTLQFSVLLCQGNPHYLIDEKGIDINSVIYKESETTDLFTDGKLKWNIAIEQPHQDLKDGDIAVNVLESATVDQPNAYHLVFAVDNNQNPKLETFHYLQDGVNEPGKGLISNPLPPFPQNGQHTFYIYQTDSETNTKKWIRIGALSKPEITTDYPCQYHVTLDNQGILRMHAGEVPYWTSTNQECLQEEGCVYRAELELQPNEIDKERDPFCGIH
ncbi:virulence factor SrfB [Anabaena aphanizomenioides LEGE 00250]|uniref:Virulence factor SrfB n=1 Tax=Sphaerospermopsis aphanizomenoides LEGE 00250 TaxID=2777972 RepID=A0ABR9VLA0_9CYAN|nr:virulence factor SrfB [Sphaerospermopsis aphanizomenoides]MBE9238842.1 virulence factor SrfB [Sphaerospermopsis aphanizomenoides LEGE 00250]